MRWRAASLFLLILALLGTGTTVSYADQDASVTSSGETLYYVNTIPPAISVVPTSLDFGVVSVGNSNSLSVTVTNTGVGRLVIGTVTAPGSPYSITSDTCSSMTYFQNGTCIITVKFAPTANGAFPSNFTIPSNDPTTPYVNVTVTGTTIGPSITATPNPMDFGSVGVGNSSTLALTVQDNGSANLVLGTIGAPAAPYSITGGTCTNGYLLTPSQTCTVLVQYSPTSSPGPFPGSFIITSNAITTPSLTINITGNSSPLPQITVTPNPENFGNQAVGGNTSNTITVKNVGGANLILDTPTLTTPASPYSIASTTCLSGLSLVPNATCTIVLSYSPTVTGSFPSSFTISSNTGGTPGTLTTVNLSGTAALGAPSCTAAFAPTTITSGGSSTLTWTSTNDADGLIPYSCTGNLGNGTFSGASGTQSFSPTATQNCTLTVNNGSGSSNTCTAPITVVATPTCSASFSPGSVPVGQIAILSWTSTSDADGLIPYTCTGNLGSGTLSGASGSANTSPTTTQTCILTAQNAAGTIITCPALVTVTAGAPTCTASFNPTTINVGQSSTLTWTSTNDADSLIPYNCTGDLGSGTLSGASGTQSFSPTVTQTCTLTVDNGGGQTSNCTATITADGPIITGSPNPLDFGSVAVGSSSTLHVTVQNTGNPNLTFTTVGKPVAPFSQVSATCANGGSLTPSSTCTISLKFSPTTSGTFNGSFTITSNAINAPTYTVNLTGNSLPLISITPNPDNFGSVAVGSLAANTITVENVGAANLVLGNPALTSVSLPFNRVSTTCTNGLSIAPNGTCLINMRFIPTSVGNFNGSFTVSSNTGGVAGTLTTVNLSGTGTPAPPTCSANFSPTSITTPASSTLSWTSTNDADGLIPYTCTGNLGSGTFTGASGSQSFSPTASQSCTLTVDNGAGSTKTCSASVLVYGPPSCSASFSPSTITNAGGSSTLSWTSANDFDGMLPYTCTGNLGGGTLSPASGSKSFTPTATQTCTLTSQNGAGATATCNAAVTLNLGPPSCTASFNPSSVASGGPSTLSWTSVNDTDGLIPYSCTGNLGAGTFSGASGSASTSPTATQTCTLTVNNGSSSNTCAATVTVTIANPPTCTASFSPTLIESGSTSTLSWSSTNDADGLIPYTCTGNLGSGTLSGASGSSVESPNVTQTCTLTVKNTVGTTATCSATVSVCPVPATCTAYFYPSTVTQNVGAYGYPSYASLFLSSASFACATGDTYTCTPGETITNTEGHGQCIGWSGSGWGFGQEFNNLLWPTHNESVTVSLAGPWGTTTCSGNVTVVPKPTCSLSFSPASISTGQPSTLSWTSTNDADGKISYGCSGNLGSGTFSTASGSVVVHPTSSQTCEIIADNGYGDPAAQTFCAAVVQVTGSSSDGCAYVNIMSTALADPLAPIVNFNSNYGGYVHVYSGQTSSVELTLEGQNGAFPGGPPFNATFVSYTAPSPPFSIDSGSTTCVSGSTLNSSTACAIMVTATPASPGPATGTMSVTFNDGCITKTIPVLLMLYAE